MNIFSTSSTVWMPRRCAEVHEPSVCFAQANADKFSKEMHDQFKISDYPHVTQVTISFMVEFCSAITCELERVTIRNYII